MSHGNGGGQAVGVCCTDTGSAGDGSEVRSVGWHRNRKVGGMTDETKLSPPAGRATLRSTLPDTAHPLARRSAGILLHVTSLPGFYGIGDLGPEARIWVETLARAGQSWWQVLPLGPTGFGDSPYQSFSAFALNPNLLSPEDLRRDGWLNDEECDSFKLPPGLIDFPAVALRKRRMLAAAVFRWTRHASSDDRTAFDEFRFAERAWLDDYALFMALKELFREKGWNHWSEPIRRRDPETLKAVRNDLAAEIQQHALGQFLLARQWNELRRHAGQVGVRLIGDMPIFVAEDCADVWSHPELFQLDPKSQPKVVAGVPPDYFSPTGQRWGNPLYDWSAHRESGYAWWIERLRSAVRQVDVIRLDHFRGFEAYWEIPARAPTAEVGRWVPGPDGELLTTIRHHLGQLPLIAEDLGVITPAVDALRTEFDLPGMRILQFAFGGAVESRFLPHRYENPTVVYTGTHDNDTLVGWYATLTAEERQRFQRYVGGNGSRPAWAMIHEAWKSIANLAVTTAQDLFELGSEARMNRPGLAGGNWRWRMPGHLPDDRVAELAELTQRYDRRLS